MNPPFKVGDPVGYRITVYQTGTITEVLPDGLLVDGHFVSWSELRPPF